MGSLPIHCVDMERGDGLALLFRIADASSYNPMKVVLLVHSYGLRMVAQQTARQRVVGGGNSLQGRDHDRTIAYLYRWREQIPEIFFSL